MLSNIRILRPMVATRQPHRQRTRPRINSHIVGPPAPRVLLRPRKRGIPHIRPRSAHPRRQHADVLPRRLRGVHVEPHLHLPVQRPRPHVVRLAVAVDVVKGNLLGALVDARRVGLGEGGEVVGGVGVGVVEVAVDGGLADFAEVNVVVALVLQC